MSSTANTLATEYKVADLGLADRAGRKFLIAEHETPGLMSIRREYVMDKPLAGACA